MGVALSDTGKFFVRTRRLRLRVTAPQLSRSDAYESANPKFVKSIVLTLPLVALIASFVVGQFVAGSSSFYRLAMVSLGAAVLCSVPILVSLWLGLVSHKIRVDRAAPLRFVSTPSVWVFGILAALLLVLSGAVSVWSLFAPEGEPVVFALGGRVGGWVLLAGGGALAAFIIARIRVPRGLELTPAGLRWCHGTTAIIVPWRQISEVRLGTAGKNGSARVTHVVEKDGNVHDLAPVLTGSDPHIVAEIIHFFLKNPKHREALNEPQTALALVTEHV